MVRYEKGKRLKRVSGDVYLASMQLDQGRPTTCGIPLRRCSNNTKLNFPGNAPLTSVDRGTKQENVGCDWRKTKFHSRTLSPPKGKNESKTSETLVVNEEGLKDSVQSILNLNTPSSEKYIVPTNTALTPSTASKSRSSFTTTELVGTGSKGTTGSKTPPDICMHTNELPLMCEQQSSKVYQNLQNEERKANANLSSNSKFSTSNKMEHELGHAVLKNVMISTATSLDLPRSSNILPESGSESWSLKNETTAQTFSSQSQLSHCVSTQSTGGTKMVLTESANRKRSSMALPPHAEKNLSKVGDGDAFLSSGPGSKNTSEEDTNIIALPVPPPPVSAETSVSEKSDFMLKFRKPKPRLRPRTITTRSSCNAESESLPSSASTPNPITPKLLDDNNPKINSLLDENMNPRKCYLNKSARNVNVDRNNNNNIAENDIHTEDKRFPQVTLAQEFTKSKAWVQASKEGKVVVQIMPAEVAYESADAGAAIHNQYPEEQDNTVAQNDVFEPDESFWQSDSTPSDKTKEPKAHKAHAGKGHHRHHHHHHQPHQALDPQHHEKLEHAHITSHAHEQPPPGAEHTHENNENMVDIVNDGDAESHISKEEYEQVKTEDVVPAESSLSQANSGSQKISGSPKPSEAQEKTASHSSGIHSTGDSNAATSVKSDYGSSRSVDYYYKPAEPETPFLRTEKGAIRFHLPYVFL